MGPAETGGSSTLYSQVGSPQGMGSVSSSTGRSNFLAQVGAKGVDILFGSCRRGERPLPTLLRSLFDARPGPLLGEAGYALRRVRPREVPIFGSKGWGWVVPGRDVGDCGGLGDVGLGSRPEAAWCTHLGPRVGTPGPKSRVF